MTAKKIAAVIAMAALSPAWGTVYYWIANPPGSATWADATQLQNWSVEWGADNNPVTSAKATALPTSSDYLWTCRDLLMDLKGQTWTVNSYMSGKRYRISDGGEYYGSLEYPFGVTNGTLNLTADIVLRTEGGVWIENGAIVRFSNATVDNNVPIHVRDGGTCFFDLLQMNNGKVAVEPGGVLKLTYFNFWSYASRTTVVENAGTVIPMSPDTFKINKSGGGTPGAATTAILRQMSGTWNLSGPVKLNPAVGNLTLNFELLGGTVAATNDVTFDCDAATVSADATATLDVAAGSSMDMSTFTYGDGAAITKTGKGSISFGGAYPSELVISEGAANFGSAKDVVFDSLTLAAGTTNVFALGDAVATSLTVEDGAVVKVSPLALNAGSTVIASTDIQALTRFADAINASMGDDAELNAVVSDGAVVLELAGSYNNTIDVAEGETVTWSEWVEANGTPLKSVTITKTGGGTLVVDEPLDDFMGGMVVSNGTWKGSVPAHFCADGSSLTVMDGATIELAPTAKNVMNLGLRTLRLKGAGVGGIGAVVETSNFEQKDGCGFLSGTVILDGDTLVSATGSGRKSIGYHAKVDMGGHTLALCRSNINYEICISALAPFTNPGHLLFSNCTWFVDTPLPALASGGATNTISMRGSAAMKIYGCDTQSPWTLIWSGGYWKFESERDSSWYGPTVFTPGSITHLEGHDGRSLTLYGPVTGAGTVNFNRHVVTLNMPNAANDFSGAFTGVNGDSINVAGNVAGAATIGSGSLKLLGVCNLASGDLTFNGESSLTGGFGRVTSITKKGSGALSLNSHLGGGLLDVQQGSAAFSPMRGLFQGAAVYNDDESASAAAERTKINNGEVFSITNDVAEELTYTTDRSAWQNYMIATYDGYLWNNSDETVTWNFHVCIDDMANLFIDGERVVRQSGWTDVRKVDVILTPGPHRIVFDAWNGTGGAGPSDANGAWCDANGVKCTTKGLAVKRSAGSGVTSDDYEPLSANGAGYALTPGVAPVFDTVRLAAGTTLDLGGLPWTIPDLVGWGDIDNGDVTIGSSWTISSGDIGSEQLTVEGTLNFAAGVVIKIEQTTAFRLPGDGVVIAHAEGGITGPLPELDCASSRIRLMYSADRRELRAVGMPFCVIIR